MKARIPYRLTGRERQALQQEIDRQMVENVTRLSGDLTALVLWQLHTQLGFGKERLMRFYEAFAPAIREMQDHYSAENADETNFVIRYKLKQQCGIDVKDLDAMFQFEVRNKENKI
jgi:hypothetical protein